MRLRRLYPNRYPSDFNGMIDPFGRRITYLRVSVTDRCDLRCVYCMAEEMTFLPRQEVLSLEELDRLCAAFVRQGVRKLRITGGEPLVRRDVMKLFRSLGNRLGHRPRRADADDQRHPARQICPRPRGCRRSPGERQSRHARPGAVHRDHPAWPDRTGPGGDRRRRPPPGCTSRSTRWRSRASTRTRSPICSPGAASAGMISA